MQNAITNFINKYCKRKNFIFLSFIYISFAESCGRTDFELGEDLVPLNLAMSVGLDSSITIKTFILSGDTLATSRCGTFYWGAKSDDCGVMAAEFAAQFYPKEMSEGSFNGEVKVDSLTLTLAIKGALGDYSFKQQMHVCELKDKLYADSTYYSDFDINQLEHSFLSNLSIVGSPGVYTYKLYDVKLGADSSMVDWVNRLAGYKSNDGFYDEFEGLYFRRSQQSYGAVYEIDPENTYMTLYYKIGSSQSDTTRKMNYCFSQVANASNTGVSQISYDYSQTMFADQIDSILSDGSEYCLVQTLGGVKSAFVLERSQIDMFKNKIKAQGYRNVAINSALLTFSLAELSDSTLNQALTQIGLFKRYRSFTSQYDSVLYDDSTKRMLLNRMYGIYTVDLTSEINEMLRDGGENKRIIIAALPKYNLYKLQQTIISGSALVKNAPKLKLKYTAIGKQAK